MSIRVAGLGAPWMAQDGGHAGAAQDKADSGTPEVTPEAVWRERQGAAMEGVPCWESGTPVLAL